MFTFLGSFLAALWDWHIHHFSGGIFTACLTTAAFLVVAALYLRAAFIYIERMPIGPLHLEFEGTEEEIEEETEDLERVDKSLKASGAALYGPAFLVAYTLLWLIGANTSLSASERGLTLGNIAGGVVIVPCFFVVVFRLYRGLPVLIDVWGRPAFQFVRLSFHPSALTRRLRSLKRIDKCELDLVRQKLDQHRASAAAAHAQLAATEAEARELLHKYRP